MKLYFDKDNNMSDITLTPDEYPPKYIGTKGSGKKKMVYRVDGEKGLVWYQERHFRTIGYRWEHFKTIEEI